MYMHAYLYIYIHIIYIWMFLTVLFSGGMLLAAVMGGGLARTLLLCSHFGRPCPRGHCPLGSPEAHGTALDHR